MITTLHSCKPKLVLFSTCMKKKNSALRPTCMLTIVLCCVLITITLCANGCYFTC